MTTRISRRGFGGIMGGAALASTWASVGRAAGSSVRLIWWGNPERDKRTYAVVDQFMKSSGNEVLPETYSWNDYWQKLATQAAGQNLPDIIQMDYRYIFEWARREQLAALDEYLGNGLDLGDFDQNQLDSGKVDGKLYGVSMGANSMSHVYNKTVFDRIGATVPDSTKWSNEDFAAFGKELKGSLPEGMFFTENMGSLEPRLQTWLRGRGKDLYTAEGQLAYEEQDLADYFAYWKMMQDEGLTPPADIQAQDTGKMEEKMNVIGKAALGFIHSNQLVAAQNLMQDEIDFVMVPAEAGGPPAQYLKPSMFLSMAAGAADPKASIELMNYFITSDEANDVLLIERGVTGDGSIRERILPGLTPTEQKIIRYLDTVATHVSPLPPPPPTNAGELDRALRPSWESVAFGQADAATAAKDYYANAQAVLART
jgi:multiple sugar transport system substrate-binding protein